MGYQIKSYRDWKTEKTNEGIVDLIKNVSKKLVGLMSKVPGLTWLGDKFGGDGAWVMNVYMKQKKGELPKGVEVYPSKTTKQIVDAALGEKAVEVEENEMSFDINEAEVATEHPNPDVENVDYEKLQSDVEAAVLARINGFSTQYPPILIWGAPGIGKTQIVEGIAKKYDMDCVVAILSTIPPDNLMLPSKDERTGKGSTIPADFLPVYDSKSPMAKELEAEENVPGPDGKPRGGILFFDELSRAPKPNLSAALSLVEDRKLGRWNMADKWVIVAAANRDEDDPDGVYNFSTAMGNRFQQVNLVPDLPSWSKWASEKVDADTGELIFDPAMIEFLKMNKDLFYKLDPDVSAEIFPSPRTWTKAAEAITVRKRIAKMQGKDLTLGDIEREVSKLVGKSAARQYIGYLNLVKSVDPKTLKYVYTDQAKAALPKKEKGDYVSDVTSAMITAIILDKKGEKLTPNQIKNLFDYAIRLEDPTWATILVRKFMELHPYFNENSPKFDEAYQDSYNENLENFIENYPGSVVNYDEEA